MSLVNSNRAGALRSRPDTVRTRKTYTDADKAKLLVALQANGGNLKRTARETGTPLSTMKQFRAQWEEEMAATGQVSLPTDLVEEASEEFIKEATEVRDLALARIREIIPNSTSLSQLIAVVGVLDDKKTRAEGIPTGTTEHTVKMPDIGELASVISDSFRAMHKEAIERNQDIIDVDVVEQPIKGLPTGG